jgi:hypothetical protein
MSFEGMIRTAEDYRRTAQKKSNAHYRMSELAGKKHTKIGVPAATVSAIVGTAIFSTVGSAKENLLAQIVAGLLSLLATILVSLQTFFNFSEVSSKHREAAANYEAIRHKLDWFVLAHAKLQDSDNLEQPLATLLEIASSMDQIRRAAPSIPDSVYDVVETSLSSKPTMEHN